MAKDKKKTNDQQSEQDTNDDAQSHDASSTEPAKEGFFGKMKRKTANAGHASKLSAYKKKKQTQNQMLKSKLHARKEKFGTDYLTLKLEQGGDAAALQACQDEALAEIKDIQAQIDRNLEKMDHREEEVNEKIITDSGEHKTMEKPAASENTAPAASTKKPFWNMKNKNKAPSGRNPNAEYYPEPQGLAGSKRN